MNAWTVVLAAGLGSLVLRLSMITLTDWVRVPARMDRASTLVAPAAFAALASSSITATVLTAGGVPAIAPLFAVAVAVVAVLRTGSSHAAVLAGMPALWLCYAVLPG